MWIQYFLLLLLLWFACWFCWNCHDMDDDFYENYVTFTCKMSFYAHFISYKESLKSLVPSVFWCCWLGSRKGIWPVKNWVMGPWDAGVLTRLERDADLHMAQLMPLPLTISCSSKSRLVLTCLVLPFWYLLTQVDPDIFQKSSKTVCVCVCVCLWQWNNGQTSRVESRLFSWRFRVYAVRWVQVSALLLITRTV